jgi:hypothetical protein
LAVVWSLMATRGENLAPPVEEALAPPADVAPIEQVDPAASAPASTRASQSSSDDGQRAPERVLSNTVFGTIELRAVVDNDSGEAPLESFRWAASGTAIGIEPRGVSEGRVARIRVPVDVDAAVVVDADGCKTSLPVDIALRGEQFRAVTVRMRPYYEKARITLRCKDEFGAPVPHIFVRCEHQSPQAESRREWMTLWTRNESSPNGVYAIDAQVAGWCRFYVAPMDGKGRPRTLLPEQFEARLSDDRRIEQELVHHAGGTVSLEWNEREPMPKGVAAGSVRLYDEADRERRVHWLSDEAFTEEVGAPTLRYSVLPCRSGEAHPAGRYTVRIRGEDVDLQKSFEIRSGQNTHVVFP